MKNSYFSILSIVLHGRASGRILIATILSFTFSIAVILCTFGLMDGFDHLLKSGLRHSSGDIIITHKKGFFDGKELERELKPSQYLVLAPVIQTEAFALLQGKSRGVLVRGVEQASFPAATGLKMQLVNDGLIIGVELARQLGVKINDEIALTLGRGNETAESLPTVRLFRINGIVNHGIFQKDLRFIYLDRKNLAEVLGVGEKINLMLAGYYPTNQPLEDLEGITSKARDLRQILGADYRIKRFWDEYDFLIEAVKVEKFSISLILQLIVVVAIFNIIAFVIYVMEKKSQDFFFLRAVGMSLHELMRFWFISVLWLWSISCVGAYLLSILFNWALKNLSIFQLPGEIYVLSQLDIRLDLMAHVTVYAVSLLWVLAAALVGYFRLRGKPIIQGLRQEFS